MEEEKRVWEPHVCDECGKCGLFTKCGGCKATFYCGKQCQLKAWKKSHKTECVKSRVNHAAETIATKWRTTRTIDLSLVPAEEQSLLIRAGIVIKKEGRLSWMGHSSFGDFFAAKGEVARVCRITDDAKRAEEIRKLREKQVSWSSTEPSFLNFFNEMLEDEEKKRNLKAIDTPPPPGDEGDGAGGSGGGGGSGDEIN